MTVGELRDLLEDVDDDVEVRTAQQPRWAFEYAVDDATLVEACVFRARVDDYDTCVGCGEATDDHVKDAAETKSVFYLTEGSQLGYLPGYVATAIGWSE